MRRRSRKPKRRPIFPRGPRNPSGGVFRDWVGTALSSGGTQTFTLANFALQRDRPFVLSRAMIQYVAYTEGGAGNTGVVQFEIFGPQSGADGVYTTGPLLYGIIPQRVTLSNPRPVFYPSDAATTTPLFRVNQIKQATADTSAVRFIACLEFRLGPEEFVSNLTTRLAFAPQGDEWEDI